MTRNVRRVLPRHTQTSEDEKPFRVAQAPSAAAAAQQFMDLSQEYLQIVPKLHKQTVPFGDTVSSRTTRRVAALAVVMQRKFVTPGENTYIPGLIDRIYREQRDLMAPELRRKVRHFQAELPGALKELHEARVSYVRERGPARSTSDLPPLILNGRLLHSDYPKWDEGGPNPWFAASSSFLQAQSKFRRYLQMARWCLIDLHEAGALPGLEFSENFGEDTLASDGVPYEIPKGN